MRRRVPHQTPRVAGEDEGIFSSSGVSCPSSSRTLPPLPWRPEAISCRNLPLESRTLHCSLASFPAGCPGNPVNLILSDDEGLAGLMSQYLFIAQPAPGQTGMLTWGSDIPRWGWSPAALFPAAVEVEGFSPGKGAWMWVQSLSMVLSSQSRGQGRG